MSEQYSMFFEPAAVETLPYQPHSETSKAAAVKAVSKCEQNRAAILRLLIGKLGGFTDEEIQNSLGMNPNTQRPRRIELVTRGLVEDSGRTRKTSSGSPAVIWQAVANVN